MSKKEVAALSLFSGIGGFEMGMARCGFSFAKTLEWDEKCCETLNHNKKLLGIKEREIVPRDITKTAPKDFYKGKVDYIVGGPPCQSFSAAGRRAGGVAGIDDLRGTLFEYYGNYVAYFQPKAFVFENVRGIVSAHKGEDFRLILQSFEKIGYDLFWRILNAADYGAPQLRERVFLVGIRKDLKVKFRFPLPTYGVDSPQKRDYVTTREAILDLQDEDEEVLPYGGKYGHLLPDIPPGENYRFYTEEMGHPNPQFAWRSKFSNFLYKMDPEDVCRTIIAYQGKYDGPFHWKNRKCTIAELQRLQGFPKEFLIKQTYAEGVKQIGNSVCPMIAEQIGKALRFQIEGRTEFEIPLIAEGQTLSFDKRKGLQAKKSRAKKVKNYSDLVKQETIAYVDFQKEQQEKEYHIIWKSESGHVELQIAANGSRKRAAELKLSFMGTITASFLTISAVLFAEAWREEYLKRMWDEIHTAVRELSSYDSLLPLYGHFTEPYPKFTVSFYSDITSELIEFQKMALDTRWSNQLLSYEQLGRDALEITSKLRRIREAGFDVRTHHTNKTIPEQYFRICYPFTMPNTVKPTILWKEG